MTHDRVHDGSSYLRFRPCSRKYPSKVDPSLVERILAGDRRAVARAVSMVEDGDPELPDLSAALYPHTGEAYTVGLTGSPGVGKSSLAGALLGAARRRETPTAVLAVDPTSPFSGGALLGDRLRMQEHATDPGVFIRSMATRGHLGGIALAAPEAVRVLDASGARLVLVETVGVGQAEVDVATATDTTIVVVAPGWGDAVQVSKAGILEIADVFAVNKADRDGANEALRDLEVMIRMGPRTEWTPPVIRTSTIDGSGVEEVFEAISAHRVHQQESGALERRRRARQLHEVERMAAEAFRERIATGAGDAQLARDLQERRIDPYAAAAILVERAGAVDAPSA